MRRREFITPLGGVAAAWPRARVQQRPAMPVVGYLGAATFESSRDRVAAFHRGLAETGHIEGSNVAIEYRWAIITIDCLRWLPNWFAVGQPLSSVGGSTPGALALKAATQTIPIVFQIGSDAVEIGLVARERSDGMV